MKTSNKIFTSGIAIVCTLLLASLIYLKKHVSSSSEKEGSELKNENQNLEGFNKIHLTGNFDVKLNNGQHAIKISADERSLNNLDIKVQDSTLIIGMKKEGGLIIHSSEINLEISYSMLNELISTGNSDVEMITDNNTPSFEVVQIGNGEIKTRTKSNYFKANLTGNGNISNNGSADNIVLSMLGNGDIDLSETEASTAEVTLIGNGNFIIQCKESIKGTLTGNGEIHYKGTDKVSVNKIGNGDVIKDN
ncbi:MAG: DUF2807 domain-containing protein [Saprospiraceae bacterium]